MWGEFSSRKTFARSALLSLVHAASGSNASFPGLMLMYKDEFVNKWVTVIKSRMSGMCEENFVIPVIALFYNDAATRDILDCKRKMRLELAAIEHRHQKAQRAPWYFVCQRLRARVMWWRDCAALRIGVWRQQLTEEAVNKCLCRPEFEFLKYLHNLTEHMAAWRAFPDKHLAAEQLPKEFVDVKGPLDAPFAEYEALYRIQETADAFIPAELQRTMFAVMLSEMIRKPEQNGRAQTE
jgi:hypothetical protein